MSVSPRLKHWLKKILKVIVIAEITYVIAINGLLQIPLTQTVINKIRPEKFHISWENAWSWYPARVHVRGGFANGNSRGQMWQFEAASVDGSVALLPLIAKQVRVSNVSAEDIDFRLRPRLKQDKDYSQIEAFFPVIEGRDVTSAVTTQRKKKRPWNITLDDIHVGGNLSYWIYQIRGKTGGDIRANMEYRSRGGPLALDVFDLDLDLDTHYINGDQVLFDHGTISGAMGFAPFRPRENKGLAMLDFLLLDLTVNIDVNSLKFIKLFALNLKDFDVDGSGLVGGRLKFEKGQVMEGSDLAVDARDLRVKVLSHNILGSGVVSLAMGPDTENQLDLGFRYSGLEVVHDGDSQPLLTGDSLELRLSGDGRLVPDPEHINESRMISFVIDDLEVPDLALFQRYLPEKWPFKLYGGDGRLQGQARLSPAKLLVDMKLSSEEADMGIRQYRFLTNLDSALKLDNPSIMTGGTKVTGSYISLTDAHLLKEGQKSEEAWSASLSLNEGQFTLFNNQDKQGDTDLKDLFRILGDSEARQLLGNSGGQLDFDATVSSLAWIGVFLGDSYKTEIEGHSEIEGTLNLAAGLPEPGTEVKITSEELGIKILDYVSNGDGLIALEVKEGGSAPDWLMTVELSGADLRRRSDSAAYIQDVNLSLEALVEDVTFDKDKNKRFALSLKIPSANVTDMSVFNAYIPPDTPLKIVGGQAQLGADILLMDDDADGWVKLDSNGIEAEVDDQELMADLGIEITLVDGVPADMMFDITGSRVVLDNVRVKGEEDSFDEENWTGVLELTRGETVFMDPMKLDLEAKLSISDSRPVVTMFRNEEGWRPEFIARMLTLEDIAGTATLNMDNDRLVIPEAYVTSDNVDMGMKAVFTPERRDGVIYLKYKKLDALLKIRNGKKNLDLIGVRKKYDEYDVKAIP